MVYGLYRLKFLQRRNKYGNKVTISNGIRFDSKKEAHRYFQLKMQSECDMIKDLVLQPRFKLFKSFIDKTWKRQRAIFYVADFMYYDNGLKKKVIEDVKGVRTKVYMMKRKMLLKILEEDTIFREV